MAQDVITQICTAAPVIPVLVVDDPAHGVPLAQALVGGGLTVLEVTMRTPAALDVIREMRQVEGAIVGAGTVLTAEDAAAAKAAGAQFSVSPGATDRLIAGCADAELPLLPGAATASEAMALAEQGFEILKFFPAEAAGGAAMVKSLGSPLPHIKFCPTGGISPQNLSTYMDLPNVLCCGGSWVAPQHLITTQDWAAIGALAWAAARKNSL